jgi:hypothetical protein
MRRRTQSKSAVRYQCRDKDDLTIRKLRSAITNGTKILPAGDRRMPHMRRLADLLAATCADLGGEENMSAGQLALARHLALLQVQLELMAAQWIDNDGGASPGQLMRYQTAVNTLRRLAESLNIHRGRIARDVTPTIEQYEEQVRARQRTRQRALSHEPPSVPL